MDYRAWKALLGLVILAAVLGIVAPQIRLDRYKRVFSDVQHPPETWPVDSLALQIEYYPATYADESMQFESAYFVGQLRSYEGPWRNVVLFYGNQTLDQGSSTPVTILVLPVRIGDNQVSIDTESGFASGYGYALDPFTADLLSNIQEHYKFWGMPNSLKENDQNLYLVYCLWQT